MNSACVCLLKLAHPKILRNSATSLAPGKLRPQSFPRFAARRGAGGLNSAAALKAEAHIRLCFSASLGVARGQAARPALTRHCAVASPRPAPRFLNSLETPCVGTGAEGRKSRAQYKRQPCPTRRPRLLAGPANFAARE